MMGKSKNRKLRGPLLEMPGKSKDRKLQGRLLEICPRPAHSLVLVCPSHRQEQKS
jgi:hypothetical protein